ncbi:MAG: M55 family metallopeptidase [Candidatus Riflebacteria bacterium]|nr:M55 family metallopeptidase [Candidatus Riflebacteria bacterium]
MMSIVILADIEGSSGCTDREGARWLTRDWIAACREMTFDVRAVVVALQALGIAPITVVDFHRTGFNLFSELLPPGIRLRQGYRLRPIPGLGRPPEAGRAFFLGMHAAAGTEGFLAHTLTSRFRRLTVNGRPLAEVELFAGSLGAWGIRPTFFSGCPVACDQAAARISGLAVHPVPSRPMTKAAREEWRHSLAEAASRAAIKHEAPPPYRPTGPFHVQFRWKTHPEGAQAGREEETAFSTNSFADLYWRLLRQAYFPSVPPGWLPLALRAHAVMGRAGLALARRRWDRTGDPR